MPYWIDYIRKHIRWYCVSDYKTGVIRKNSVQPEIIGKRVRIVFLPQIL
jgi:hypothetical protein